MRRTTMMVALMLVTACGGGGEDSLTEYVERLNVIVEQAREDYETLVADPTVRCSSQKGQS